MAADLLCLEEASVVRRATKDAVILQDERVLENLLAAEDRDNHRSAPLAYFKFQTEIQPFMRKVVTTWMLEVGKRDVTCHISLDNRFVSIVPHRRCYCSHLRDYHFRTA